MSDYATDQRAHLKAAVDVLSGTTLAWGQSALALHDLADHPSQPVVATTVEARCRSITVVTRSDLAGLGSTTRHGIPTVPLPVAVASMASALPLRAMDDLVDDAIRKRLTTWPRLEAAFRSLSGRGRAGAKLLNQLVAERSIDSTVPLSIWSRDVAAKLVASGLGRPAIEWRVTDSSGRLIAQVDLAYPKHRYAIELDSVAFHHNRVAFEEDRRRDARLAQHGWRVGRFTWQQFTADWDQIAATVAAQLRQPSVVHHP